MRAALTLRDQERDIWIWDFGRQLLARLTLDPGQDFAPAWTPDGKRVVFASRRNGANIASPYWQAADGTGAAERLVDDPRSTDQFAVSPDGRYLVMHVTDTNTFAQDIALLDLAAKPRHLQPLIATRFDEQNPAISPDGRWILYQSNESGRDEVYARPFPNVEGGRWQVSTNGGRIPRWTSNGREILFVGNPGGWWIAPVAAGAAFSVGPPRAFVAPGPTASNTGMDPSIDGKRFIAVQRDEQAAVNRINVVLNWFTALRVPL
jgi:serine/threonine-protein kinase